MPDVKQRARMAAESLLDNEALRGGLDEIGSKALLAWGIQCAEAIALETAAMNDEEAEAFTYPRMKALRKMLGAAKNFAQAEDFGARRAALDEALEFAPNVYGQSFERPSGWALGLVVLWPGGAPAERLQKVHDLLKKPSPEGEKQNEQENP